jgi:AbiU2
MWMAEEQSGDGVNINKMMPIELQRSWDALQPEVRWVHGRWLIYLQLFGKSQQRVDLLNKSASVFFVVIQQVLFESIQLTLVKLADPAKRGNRSNLTLETLLEEPELGNEPELFAKLRGMLHKYRTLCGKIRQIRNQRLAHFDRETLLGTVSLNNSSRDEIENALTTLRDFLNIIEKHFVESETAYEQMIIPNNGDVLAQVLNCGLSYKELRKVGKISWNDLSESPFYKA